MALFDLKIDPALVERGVRALEKIAFTLEEYCFPLKNRLPSESKPAGPEALTEFDPEKEWEREQQEAARKGEETPSP